MVIVKGELSAEDAEESANDDVSSDGSDNQSEAEDSDEEPLSKKLERARKRIKVDDQNASRETGYGSTSDSDEPLSHKLARYKAKTYKMTARKKEFKVWRLFDLLSPQFD